MHKSTLFPNPNHTLNDQLSNRAQIILINKPACLKIITANQDLFHEHLGNLSAEEIFEKYVRKFRISKPLLMGILYGYGRKNCQLFQKREDAERALALKTRYPLKIPQELQDYEYWRCVADRRGATSNQEIFKYEQKKVKDLLEDYYNCQEQLTIFKTEDSDDCFDAIFSVRFVCLQDDPETKSLEKQYTQWKLIRKVR